mmetsp:Transcript_29252/g.76636  ORF Transcript_29252/g.76636 Transcript_29252/m.76636 type:complete len:168 (-) Transcript_29252:82-585(-)
MHTKGVVHFDIKLENMLIAGPLIKLCDFGLSGLSGEVRSGRAQGTSAYMAPELLAVRSHQKYVLLPAYDLWSFGIVVYAVIFASLPWDSATKDDALYQQYVCGGEIETAELWDSLSIPFRETLLGMLSATADRPPISDVVDALRRPWFKPRECTRPARKELTAHALV